MGEAELVLLPSEIRADAHPRQHVRVYACVRVSLRACGGILLQLGRSWLVVQCFFAVRGE